MGSARRDAAMLAGSADGCWGSDRKDGRREGRDWRVESVLTEEGLEIVDNLLLGDGEVVVEEEEELLLHKVYLLLGEHLRVAALFRVSKSPPRDAALTQCLFFGDESLRYLAATMRVAKKTR